MVRGPIDLVGRPGSPLEGLKDLDEDRGRCCDLCRKARKPA